jgi:hypothetical protein
VARGDLRRDPAQTTSKQPLRGKAVSSRGAWRTAYAVSAPEIELGLVQFALSIPTVSYTLRLGTLWVLRNGTMLGGTRWLRRTTAPRSGVVHAPDHHHRLGSGRKAPRWTISRPI